MNQKKDEILEKLIANKQKNLQLLTTWSFEDLQEVRKRYREAYQDTKSEAIWEKACQISEAIDIKKGNEEQAWDYLT
jgi:phosphoglycolate phosphatase-like HAD superfamily hydrolase